ncbi:MOSC domain-containing protein [Defluviimonas aestuarii]|uniref:MOSC domain-containing protein n=1 Tax=Albidovulum aestuarii TaxID=1130726 RepID=UPI00249CEC77|nr:MOSC domain-containing protein [Defluviimonas aestuarii]MDI3336523.1 MOSC domain-containing protein [Defluviimonas aestuarii]
MPALIPTEHHATVTWLGYVPHRKEAAIETRALDQMPLGWEGFAGDFHSGVTRQSCSRVVSQHPKNTEIRNVRQVSVVSAEELAEIAATLGVDAIDPAWLGASIVLSGILDFSHVPPSSRLQSENGTTLVVDMQNRPCRFPALTIGKARPGQGRDFKEAAEGKRGVTAWVERPGGLVIGDRLRLHVPDQRAWLASGTDRPKMAESAPEAVSD